MKSFSLFSPPRASRPDPGAPAAGRESGAPARPALGRGDHARHRRVVEGGPHAGVGQGRDNRALRARQGSRSQSRVGRAVLYDWSSGVTTELTVDLQAARSAPDDRRHRRSTRAPRGDRSRNGDRARRSPRGAGAGRTRRHRLDRITFLGGLGEGTRLPRRGSSIPLVVSPLVWDGIGNDMEVRGFDVRVDLAGGTVEEVFESLSVAGRHSAGPRPVRGVRCGRCHLAAEWSELQHPRQRDSLGSLAHSLRRPSPARSSRSTTSRSSTAKRRGRCSIAPGSPS